jgi:signal peptidase I
MLQASPAAAPAIPQGDAAVLPVLEIPPGGYPASMKIDTTVRQILPVSALVLALLGTATAGAEQHVVAGMTDDAAVSEALQVADHRLGMSVMRIAGRSMEPYFGDGAVVVVKKIDAAHLRIGMIAVYVNRFGEKVAHLVIAPVAGGWQVKGNDNDRPDSTLVDAGNLLGVVYATFAPVGKTPIAVAAANLPAIETVYAAAAK